MTLQRSDYFWLLPKFRTYRNPRQLWFCWLGWSIHHSTRMTDQGA
jgi:hypothetical protein